MTNNIKVTAASQSKAACIQLTITVRHKPSAMHIATEILLVVLFFLNFRNMQIKVFSFSKL